MRLNLPSNTETITTPYYYDPHTTMGFKVSRDSFSMQKLQHSEVFSINTVSTIKIIHTLCLQCFFYNKNDTRLVLTNTQLRH